MRPDKRDQQVRWAPTKITKPPVVKKSTDSSEPEIKPKEAKEKAK